MRSKKTSVNANEIERLLKAQGNSTRSKNVWKSYAYLKRTEIERFLKMKDNITRT